MLILSVQVNKKTLILNYCTFEYLVPALLIKFIDNEMKFLWGIFNREINFGRRNSFRGEINECAIVKGEDSSSRKIVTSFEWKFIHQ